MPAGAISAQIVQPALHSRHLRAQFGALRVLVETDIGRHMLDVIARRIVFVMPLHGAAFDVRDGCVKGKPALEPIRTYSLRAVDGRIQLSLEPA